MNTPKEKEVLTRLKTDRRLLSNVPDPEYRRRIVDRRGSKHESSNIPLEDVNEIFRLESLGLRYLSDFNVDVIRLSTKERFKREFRSDDISATGILIHSTKDHEFKVDEKMTLHFTVPGGVMPEGFEATFKIDARVVRTFIEEKDGKKHYYYAYEFEKPLTKYLKRRRWGLSIFTASIMMFFISLVVVLMRAESVIYFQFNKFLYLYSIIAATFLLSRYFFGMLYREVPVNPKFEPGVSIIIPAFNEERWIHKTIINSMNQYYPTDKLEVIVVDDCSTDQTLERAKETASLIHAQGERFKTKERLKIISLPENKGKREALMAGVHRAKHDFVVFVDSDSFLEPHAIRNLVQPFQDPKVGGVSGRTEVENKFTNSLTKLQTVRYYVAFRIMKAAESWFDAVTCLSGPLSCYRKELVLEHADAWLNQTFLGQPATFGDDRSMTNFVLRSHRTAYQDQAVCSTIVPSKFYPFLLQQMRWKRSWLRESLRAFSFLWRKEPFMFLFFIIGLIVPIAAPIVVIYNLIWVPITYGIVPKTFLVGLLLMAMLLSLAHLLFKRSKLWAFGFVFVLIYEFVLLWQMPVAWVTFWKSEWGTRETPQDVEARKRREKSRWRIWNFRNKGEDEK